MSRLVQAVSTSADSPSHSATMGRGARRCVACDRAGHNASTCTSKAAQLIRSLREKVGLKRVGQKRKPGRAGVKKTGVPKQEARDNYTKRPCQPRLKIVRRLGLRARKGKGLIGVLGADDFISLQNLQGAGYVPKHSKCPFCKKGKLTEPGYRKDTKGKQLWRRCTRYACHRRFNVLKHSYFSGTKLTVKQLALVIKRYTSLDNMSAPAVDDLAAEAEAGRDAVKSVVNKLRHVESHVAKKQNERGQIAGDLFCIDKLVFA